jgi:hypothetical protein
MSPVIPTISHNCRVTGPRTAPVSTENRVPPDRAPSLPSGPCLVPFPFLFFLDAPGRLPKAIPWSERIIEFSSSICQREPWSDQWKRGIDHLPFDCSDDVGSSLAHPSSGASHLRADLDQGLSWLASVGCSSASSLLNGEASVELFVPSPGLSYVYRTHVQTYRPYVQSMLPPPPERISC